MGQHPDEIPDRLIAWILKQKMFWVGSAPLTPDGHVNVSPKSVPGTFHVVNSKRVWYEDLTGSGSETVSHIRENGRLTIMFHAFEGPPNIVRLFGKGSFYEFGTPEYDDYIPAHARTPGSRAVIVLDILKVGMSCGFAIPIYEFKRHRTKLIDWCAKLEAIDAKRDSIPADAHPESKGMRAWWEWSNTTSLDGLTGLTHAYKSTIVPATLPDAGRKGLEMGGGGNRKVNGSVRISPTTARRAEELRLILAFSAGLAVAAVYFHLAGRC